MKKKFYKLKGLLLATIIASVFILSACPSPFHNSSLLDGGIWSSICGGIILTLSEEHQNESSIFDHGGFGTMYITPQAPSGVNLEMPPMEMFFDWTTIRGSDFSTYSMFEIMAFLLYNGYINDISEFNVEVANRHFRSFRWSPRENNHNIGSIAVLRGWFLSCRRQARREPRLANREDAVLLTFELDTRHARWAYLFDHWQEYEDYTIFGHNLQGVRTHISIVMLKQ